VASLGEVEAALRTALDKIDKSIAAHHQAADLAEEARDILAVAGARSSHGDVEQACEEFTTVIDGIREPEGQASGLAHAATLIRSYLDGHDINSAPTLTTTPVAPDSTPPPASTNRIDALRGELPPPVQPRTGAKTHGRWVGADGRVEEMVSGDDTNATAAWTALVDEGYPLPGQPWVASHVEMKLAAHMRTNDIKSAELVINNTPCLLDLGCESLIGVVLPAGSSLTVHGVNGYTQTFTGGKRPPWRR